MKPCIDCGKEFETKRGKFCKSCRINRKRESNRRYHYKNRDKNIERMRKYRKTHQDYFINYRKKNLIKCKIEVYKTKDKMRGRKWEDDEYITQTWIREELYLCKLKCHYCNCEMKTEFDKYDQKQWSVDRMENSKAHIKENCCICCLGCNNRRPYNKSYIDFKKTFRNPNKKHTHVKSIAESYDKIIDELINN